MRVSGTDAHGLLTLVGCRRGRGNDDGNNGIVFSLHGQVAFVCAGGGGLPERKCSSSPVLLVLVPIRNPHIFKEKQIGMFYIE